MKFQEGNTYGKGRRKGSKGRVNKERLIELVNLCVDDITINFEGLTIDQKIKILQSFKDVFKAELTEDSNTENWVDFYKNINEKDLRNAM